MQFDNENLSNAAAAAPASDSETTSTEATSSEATPPEVKSEQTKAAEETPAMQTPVHVEPAAAHEHAERGALEAVELAELVGQVAAVGCPHVLGVVGADVEGRRANAGLGGVVHAHVAPGHAGGGRAAGHHLLEVFV